LNKLTTRQREVLEEMAAGAIGYRDETMTLTKKHPTGRLLSTGARVDLRTFDALLGAGFIQSRPTRLIGECYEITKEGQQAASSK
jgi:hypothetical protein